ncbi:hypothetical protein [Burkholderia sp. Ac-20365]|uniref:hypothetical protein n=1 Tax=Burkholderia sp. Ac-20365 TaxID=2703897 RepID=UPI00197C600E|nr:hypothetical protein [Burkholderia sp. Ac-20365]MBN3760908.1 hypothetical protein [Burkholderia sp. Ac-20365]
MPTTQGLPEDVTLVLRFIRAVALALLALGALGLTLAMFWKDMGLSSYFDHWFGTWSDGALTILTIVVDALVFVALRATQKSEARLKQRQNNP